MGGFLATLGGFSLTIVRGFFLFHLFFLTTYFPTLPFPFPTTICISFFFFFLVVSLITYITFLSFYNYHFPPFQWSLLECLLQLDPCHWRWVSGLTKKRKIEEKLKALSRLFYFIFVIGGNISLFWSAISSCYLLV